MAVYMYIQYSLSYILSSASEKELAEAEGPPYRRFFRLARGRVGDYSYVHEERAGALNHSCRYTARVPPAVPNVTYVYAYVIVDAVLC